MCDNLETNISQVIYTHRDCLYLADTQSQWVNVQTNAATSFKQGFDYGGSRPHHGVKNNGAGSGQATNESARQLRRKLCCECVDIVRGVAAVFTMEVQLTFQKRP